ncbi:MAG: hypothetical protein RhofKO_26660 [Rhodothermales bacterium]
MADSQRIHIIYLRSGQVLLSKQPYADWQAIQAAHADYMTSLGPWSAENIRDYFAQEYGTDDAAWPFAHAQLDAFFNSTDGDDVLRSSR